ncbi:MAG: hypothetical protein N2234_04750 [Planctomycetota bacterium]|nr:hypothetical protein [Planctomycetota bacterium]
MEKVFLKIFIAVVALSAAAGFVGNLVFDIKARMDAQRAVETLAELSRKGDADGLLKSQQFLNILIYSSVGEKFWQNEDSFGGGVAEANALFETTARFALLCLELKDAKPSFSTVRNEQRRVLLGVLSFGGAGGVTCSLDTLMVDRQDRDRNSHWVVSSFLTPEQMAERISKSIEGLTIEGLKGQVEASIKGGGRVPSLSAAAQRLRTLCTETLAAVDSVTPLNFALFETYPTETPQTILSRFRATGKDIENNALERAKTWLTFMKSSEKQRIEELVKAVETGKSSVQELLEEFISPRLRYKEAVSTLKDMLDEFASRKRRIFDDIKSTVDSLGDAPLKQELLAEVEKSERDGAFAIEALLKRLRERKVSIPQYDRFAGELPYSVFVAGALNNLNACTSEAFSLLRQIEEHKNQTFKRALLLAGSDKTQPPLPGLLHWISSDSCFTDGLRNRLLSEIDKCLADESMSVEPLIETFTAACQDENVRARVRLISLKRLVDQLPLSPVKLKWQRAVEGRLAMWKPSFLSLLRSLRAVSSEREISRNAFPSILRSIILSPEVLTHEHIAMIKNYAVKADVEIQKRGFALKEQGAATVLPQKLVERVKPLLETVKSLPDAEGFFPKEILTEVEKIAEENLLPTDVTKQRLARLYRSLLFAGDTSDQFDSLKNEIDFLKSVLSAQELDAFERIVTERPLTWRGELAAIVKLSLGMSAYADVVAVLARFADGSSFDYEVAKKEIGEFINSEEFVRSAALEELRKRATQAVLRDEKNAASQERYKKLQKVLSEVATSREKPIEQAQEEALSLATEEENLQLRLIQSISAQVRSLSGRGWLSEAAGKYLLGILSDSVWGRAGCSPQKAREALIKDIKERSFIHNMKCFFTSRAASAEKERRDNYDSEIKMAVEWIIKQMVYLSNCAKVEGADEKLKQRFRQLTGNEEGADEMLSSLSGERLYVSTVYEVYDYRRKGTIRRGYIEEVGAKFVKVKEITRKLLVALEGKEEEEIDANSEEILKLCAELRRCLEEKKYTTYDIMFVLCLGPDWRMYWRVDGFVAASDKDVLRAVVDLRAKEGAILLGVEGW